ncbi:TPA: hypothetical protein H1008_01970 [archaeon]|nr:hypothetical protein [Candidatus Undinarchaeales archaeon SRR5007147.bin71]
MKTKNYSDQTDKQWLVLGAMFAISIFSLHFFTEIPPSFEAETAEDALFVSENCPAYERFFYEKKDIERQESENKNIPKVS